MARVLRCNARSRRKNQWSKDPSVKKTGKGGRPPAGHVRRCQGTNRHGQQCQRWAIRGSEYCPRHGGRRPLIMESRLANYYSKFATGKLRDKLEAMEAENEKRMTLYDEIDVARVICERAVSQYDAIVEEDVLKGQIGDGERRKLQASATKNLRDAIDHVSGLVAQMAKIERLSEDTLHAGNVQFILHHVTKILAEEVEELPGGKAIIDRVTQRVQSIPILEEKVVISVD